MLESPIKIIVKQELLSPELKTKFDHPYYKDSIKIIDLLILGQEDKMDYLELSKPVYLRNIFCEKPAIRTNWVNGTLEMMKGIYTR